jgi:hypothetical protein
LTQLLKFIVDVRHESCDTFYVVSLRLRLAGGFTGSCHLSRILYRKVILPLDRSPDIDSDLVGVDFCRPEASREALVGDELRKPLIQLPLSASESETECACESNSQVSLDAGYIGSLIEDPVPGEDEDHEFNDLTRTFDTKPSIVSLFACRSGFPGRLYAVLCGYAANVSDKNWKEFVDIAAQHGYLVGAGTALSIEEESNILSSLWAYHVQPNHSLPSPTAMLVILQRGLPSGLLLPKAIRDAVLGQKCEQCEKLNRGRTPGRPVAAIPLCCPKERSNMWT